MRPRTLVAAGVIVFLVSLLLSAPAAALYGWFAPQSARLRVYGIEGTLLEGRASGVLADNRTLATDLRWRWHPLRLLRGQAAFTLDSAGEGLQLTGLVAAAPWGLSLHEVQARGPLKPLLALAGQTFLPVDAQVELELGLLALRDGWPRRAEGRIMLADLAWSLGTQRSVLGDFRADVTTADEIIIAELASLRGAVEARGAARLQPDHRYTLDLRLRPTADADPTVATLLRSAGTADAQGYYRLQQDGALAPPPQAGDDEPALPGFE